MSATQLYLISPPTLELASFRTQLAAALQAVDAGVIGAFQLRLKDADDAQVIRAIKELLPICRAHEVAFIMNDRIDLCLDYDCDGVHVGQEDLLAHPACGSITAEPLSDDLPQSGEAAIRSIRQQIGDNLALGITCHASKHLAMEAAEAGADYVAFGAFYETTSKPKEKLEKWGTPTSDILTWWTTHTTVPCVAIGGITPDNCSPLVDAGADFIAIISAVWDHPNGADHAVKLFSEHLSAARSRQ